MPSLQTLTAGSSDGLVSRFAPVVRDEIVGIDPILEQVDEIVHALTHAEEYAAYGARLEPGVLFSGPPGTGKTLTARHVATASGACFVNVRDHLNGSKTNARDVSALFERAREARRSDGRPVVIFWDEFEGTARGNDGPRQNAVVAQLLAELDGVNGKSSGLLLLGATNFPWTVDQALLRPGRMGVHLHFTPPDCVGLQELLTHYTSRRVTAGDLDLGEVADLLDRGDTAALVEELVGDAWRRAVREALKNDATPALTQRDLLEASLDRKLGRAGQLLRRTDDQLFRTAVHEVGHALTALIYGVPVRILSVRGGHNSFGIVKTSGPSETVREELAQLRIAYGGFTAELVSGLGQGLGAQSDIYRATRRAWSLVEEQAVGNQLRGINPTAIAPGPRQHSDRGGASAHTLQLIDAEARALLAEALADTEASLQAVGAETIRRLAQNLIEQKTMGGTEFKALAEAELGQPALFQAALLESHIAHTNTERTA
jgi:ATP-dependent metalloprotease